MVGEQIGQKSGGDLGVAHTILIQGKAVPTVAGELGCREHGRHKGLGCFALLMQRFQKVAPKVVQAPLVCGIGVSYLCLVGSAQGSLSEALKLQVDEDRSRILRRDSDGCE